MIFDRPRGAQPAVPAGPLSVAGRGAYNGVPGLVSMTPGRHPPSLTTDRRLPMDDYQPPAADDLHAAPPPSAASALASELKSSIRLTRMLAVLGLLLVLLILPSVVKRIQYASEYGKQRARMDIARAQLQTLELDSLAVASRWVAQAAAPSVVHISTRRRVGTGRGRDEGSYFFGPPRMMRETLGEGSGVIVDERGFVLTNNHVIEGATSINVQLSDGRARLAQVVGTDALTDLAVLRIAAGDLAAATWGDSDELKTGDMVWAAGSPFGLDHSVTFGIVSAKDRPGIGPRSQFQDLLQTDAAVNPGNSGGPLVNIRGEIVGINTAIVGNAYRGVSFAIPSRIAKEVYERIRTEGKVARAWLGVRLQELTADIAEQLGPDLTEGVLVADVEPASPAQRSALQAGDLIVAWNGVEFDNPTSLSRLIAATQIGSEAELKLIRENQPRTVKVVVDERPGQLP